MGNWTRSCATSDIELDELIRFDHASQTFVIVRSHDHVHLCDGLVRDGAVECPKPSSTFDFRSGEATRACINLKTYPVKVDGGDVYIEI